MKNDPSEISLKSPTLHISIIGAVLAFFILLVMAIVLKVEVVARGEGKIIPIGRVQTVQSEFDGAVSKIHVVNSSQVKKGDILIEFDATDAVVDVNTITDELGRLDLEVARIQALLAGLDTVFSEAPTLSETATARFAQTDPNAKPQYHTAQARLLEAEISNLLAGLEQIDARSLANERSVAVTMATVNRLDGELSSQQTRLEVAKDLLDRGATNRNTYLDALQIYNSLAAEQEVARKEGDHKRSLTASFEAERRNLVSSERNRLLQRRSEIGARVANLQVQLQSRKRRLAATKLRAPVDGIVDGLQVNTVGGFVSSGSEVMRIVPTSKEIEIEAIFSNNDVGFLDVGQAANVKFDAFPAERFGYVKGSLRDVSADAIELSEGVWGFTAHVTLERTKITAGSTALDLKPGMTGTVDVITEKRTLISYFFAPITRTIMDSLGEQ